MEEWRASSEAPAYEVSDGGHIRNAKTNTQMAASKPNVTIRVGGKYVTRSLAKLVATEFIPNPNKHPIVKNINGDPSDRRVSNLKWAHAGAIFEDANGVRKVTKGASRPIWRVDINTNERIELYDSISAAVRSIIGSGDNDKVILHVNRIQTGKNEFGFAWKFDNDDMDGEIWKDVPTDKFNAGLMASNKGRIKTTNGKILTGSVSSSGYLNSAGMGFHRVVFYTWFPEADFNLEVNHKDGNKLNNAIDNLECVTRSGNAQHAHDNDLSSCEKKVAVVQMTPSGEVIERFDSYAAAESKTAVNRGCIHNAVRSKCISHNFRWAFAEDE